MSRGDHVYVRRRRHYTHHGIDCGDRTIIHYAGDRGTLRRVERTSWESFAGGSRVHIRRYRDRLPVDDIVRNAEARIGDGGYHLVTNNCEHFADAAGLHLLLLGSLSMGLYMLTRPLRRRDRRR